MYVRVTFPYCLEAVGRMCKHISTLDTRMEIVSGGTSSGQISGVRYRLRWSCGVGGIGPVSYVVVIVAWSVWAYVTRCFPCSLIHLAVGPPRTTNITLKCIILQSRGWSHVAYADYMHERTRHGTGRPTRLQYTLYNTYYTEHWGFWLRFSDIFSTASLMQT